MAESGPTKLDGASKRHRLGKPPIVRRRPAILISVRSGAVQFQAREHRRARRPPGSSETQLVPGRSVRKAIPHRRVPFREVPSFVGQGFVDGLQSESARIKTVLAMPVQPKPSEHGRAGGTRIVYWMEHVGSPIATTGVNNSPDGLQQGISSEPHWPGRPSTRSPNGEVSRAGWLPVSHPDGCSQPCSSLKYFSRNQWARRERKRFCQVFGIW